MQVVEINDLNEIKKVLYHPDIRDKIGGDLISEEDFNPIGDIQWVAGYVNSEIIGLMVYNLHNGKVYCHIQMLPEYRHKYTIKFMRMALKFGKVKNASIYAEISKDLTGMIAFAKSFNFKIYREFSKSLLLRLNYADYRSISSSR